MGEGNPFLVSYGTYIYFVNIFLSSAATTTHISLGLAIKTCSITQSKHTKWWGG